MVAQASVPACLELRATEARSRRAARRRLAATSSPSRRSAASADLVVSETVEQAEFRQHREFRIALPDGGECAARHVQMFGELSVFHKPAPVSNVVEDARPIDSVLTAELGEVRLGVAVDGGARLRQARGGIGLARGLGMLHSSQQRGIIH